MARRTMFPRHLTFFALCLSFFATAAQAQWPEVKAVHSRTGQFIVHPSESPSALPITVEPASYTPGTALRTIPNPLKARTNSLLHLEPALVAVSCERIKQALLNELGEPDSASRKIHIQLNGQIRQEETTIAPTRFENGWIYTMELPVDVDSRYYTAAVLNLLLLDLANRNADEQTVDLPKWLVTGLVAHLQANTLSSFALEANQQTFIEFGKANHYDPLVDARETFKQNMPLTFDELSWPEKLETNRVEFFKPSSHLFVSELLKMKDGKQSLREFIATLPAYKNWQFAFLGAFHSHFTKLVEVEKWWAVSQVNFSGRDPTRFWSVQESWTKLKTALDAPVDVHLTKDRLPVAAELSVQDVIQQWDTVQQEVFLQKAVMQLRGIRLRVAPEFAQLVDEYRSVLENYLLQRKKIRGSSAKNESAVNPQILKKTVCRQLDELDDRRMKLRPQIAASAASK